MYIGREKRMKEKRSDEMRCYILYIRMYVFMYVVLI